MNDSDQSKYENDNRPLQSDIQKKAEPKNQPEEKANTLVDSLATFLSNNSEVIERIKNERNDLELMSYILDLTTNSIHASHTRGQLEMLFPNHREICKNPAVINIPPQNSPIDSFISKINPTYHHSIFGNYTTNSVYTMINLMHIPVIKLI